jgi:hypothetical protein
MLLDIRKDAESIYSLIAYLETKPKKGPYDYRDCLRCPLTQYFSEKFGRPMYVDNTYYAAIEGAHSHTLDGRQISLTTIAQLPKHFDAIAVGNYTETSWTYGKMLTRARKVAGVLARKSAGLRTTKAR